MVKHIIKVLFSNGIVAAVGLLSSLFLPKILSLDEYAVYQTFYLFLTYITVLHLGFPTGMVVKYAGKKYLEIDKKQYKSELTVVSCILVFFAFVWAIVAILTRDSLQLLVAAMIIPYCFMASYITLLQSWGEFTQYAVSHAILSALPLALPIIIYVFTGFASAKLCIGIYISIYTVVLIFYLIKNIAFLRNVKRAKLLSQENWRIEKMGFSFLIGNYISLLLHSIDKQFVKWFYDDAKFAFYSFAITLQITMNMFITAVAQPLLPYMARENLSREKYTQIKRLLLILGSSGGLFYYVCEVVVRFLIPNYAESIGIIRLYFAAFPALAVINCLYMNMYKVKANNKRYVFDVSLVLVISVVANLLAVTLGQDYKLVALVTVVVYYLWLIYGAFVFEELRFTGREIIFLISFIGLFVFVLNGETSFLRIGAYVLLDFLICTLCFPKEVSYLFDYVKRFLRIGR